MRVFLVGLFALLSIACADAGPDDGSRRSALTETDAGVPPEPCGWFVYWLTMIDREEPCNWGMQSKDPAVALFRTNGGECLVPATICGVPACADITYVREKQVIEVWGPAGLEADAVWRATESFDCE